LSLMALSAWSLKAAEKRWREITGMTPSLSPVLFTVFRGLLAGGSCVRVVRLKEGFSVQANEHQNSSKTREPQQPQ
jgi:hypothetical protein